MDSLAHEIFLLMLNLSKVSSEARVRSLFLESMNAAIPGIRFRDLEDDAGPVTRTFDVRTAGMSFGRIGVDGDLDGLPDVARALIRNAIGMLAVMLERCRHLRLLEDANLRALREREASLAEAQRIARIGNWDWDARSGRIRHSVQATVNLGLPDSLLSISPRDFLERVHPEDRQAVLSRLRAGLADTGPFEFSFRVLWPDGQVRTLATRAETIGEPSGAPAAVRGTTQDITERKRLEDQLLQAQKLESVGRLAGGVAHDFNNLLTVINGYSELAISRLGPAHPLRNSLEQIRAAGERAAGLTRQLLAFSRRQVLQPRVLDLNDVIVNVEKLIRRLIGEDVELRLLLGRSPGSVRADPGQVEQVIMNLAVNSRDAMPEGGTLTLETAGVRLPDESGKTPDLPPGSYVTLTVRDTCVGMDEQTRSHIFEPFFTTKEAGKGTGLGLATVYGIVRQSGGDVSVESAPGKGAAFTVYLPCTGEGAEVLRAAGTAPPQTGRETVLLVEDEPGVRELVREMLSVLGYTTLEAACGEDALRLFLERGTGIQLLLTDVIMPGMSGRELARRVCAIRPGLKVLFMSGYPDGAIVQHGAPDLGVHLIQKPISLAELGRQVRSALDADSAAGAAV